MEGLIPAQLEYFKLRKVSLDKDTRNLTISCAYGYNRPTAENDEEPYVLVEMELCPKVPIHHDLEMIFKELAIHVAFNGDQLDQHEHNKNIFSQIRAGKEEDKTTMRVLDKIICTSVIFHKDFEENGIVHLGGMRTLASGNVLNMMLSNIRSVRTENYTYEFHNELAETLHEFHTEVVAYLNGKTAPVYVQKELPFTEIDVVD